MLNLLPPTQKRVLAIERKKRLIIVLGTVVLIFFLSLILVLLSLKIYIAGEVKAQKIILQQRRIDFQSSKTNTFKKQLEQANQRFSRINSFYQGQVSLVEVLEKIYHTLVPGMYLINFSYQKGDLIKLRLYAPTRWALEKFRPNLSDEKGFKNVKFPGKPWNKYTDIIFDTTFELQSHGD